MTKVVAKLAWLVTCSLAGGCGGGLSKEAESSLDAPVDMYAGASKIAIHRPASAGMRLHVQGVLRKNRRFTATANGFVAGQQTSYLQLAYDLNKTMLEVDAWGNAKRVRYDVGSIESTDADLPPLSGLVRGQVVRLRGDDEAQPYVSGGQRFDFERFGDGPRVSMLSGTLTEVERSALTDPFGPGYELWFEGELGRLFGPHEPQREGAEWDVDLELAKQLLAVGGELEAPTSVSGKAQFVGLEKAGEVQVQRVEAWIKGEGGVRMPEKRKIHANINRVEVKYVGLFPVDPKLPPVEHDWSLHAKGHVVLESGDALGDVQFDSKVEHQSRVLEVRR